MSKLNTALLFRSYIWLTETIYSAGYITRQEIDANGRATRRSIITTKAIFPSAPFITGKMLFRICSRSLSPVIAREVARTTLRTKTT